jgi:uncharacterized protein
MRSLKLKFVIALGIAVLSHQGLSYGQMVILSGPEKGSYNSFANDIVRVLREKDGISLINMPTGGSAFNFKKLTDPQSNYKIALIQSDYLNLMEGEDRVNNTNKTGPIKVIMSLATEEIHLVAKKSSGLKSLMQLTGKKVAIGDENQGSFATGKIINKRSKVNWVPYYAGYDLILKQLAEGTIDAGLVVGSAPVSLLDIDPQVMSDGITLLDMDDSNGWAQYYDNDTIYHNTYKWLTRDVPTFGVRTLLIVNESKLTEAEKKVIPAIKSGIIQNLSQLKKEGHPKWKEVVIPDDYEFVSEATKAAPVSKKVESEKKEEVTYRVQILSSNNQQKRDQVDIEGKTYKTYKYFYLQAYRYTIGEFKSVSDAAELQNSCRKNGFPQAFVAAFTNGVRNTDSSLFK